MDASKVPLMFRAQIRGRCQLQYLPHREDPDSVLWVDEWVDKAYPNGPEFGDEVQTKTYQVSWRFVTNGGQDEGVIRPVIGAYGWPFYPGSSMKGVFRQAGETLEQKGVIPPGTIALYCGKDDTLSPGVLRFHGGYPNNLNWTDQLIDVVHPQQNWQVETENTKNKQGGAFSQISLYQPELKFGISTTDPEKVDWDLVWQIWEKGLTQGLGCRVSAGYGQFEHTKEKPLLSFHLKGQGPASKSIDDSLEFRPNIFRAALRGHAMRIFGGLTTEKNARQIVQQLFGGIHQGTHWGLLQMNFQQKSLNISQENATYRVEGKLVWSLTRSLPADQSKALKKLCQSLLQFAMVFGGFGKSWRRADHRLFMEGYEDHIIGCHWQWASDYDLVRTNPVRQLADIAPFIEKVREVAQTWMSLQGYHPTHNQLAPWRESWHPDNVLVWGRFAGDVESKVRGVEDCQAISWLHEPYRYEYRQGQTIPLTIKGSTVAGGLNQIGRIWHRMYPIVTRKRDPNDEANRLPKITPFYLELLTLFPDDSKDCKKFIQFLQSEQSDFECLWGIMSNQSLV
ncbi:RAMP superfamily protein [Lyngbya confervoides]|uniref:RAMP superfamily protein n=1 Tax=Lyngbya confervoides BDU141951 TaxID=1574623 RepID=A0ABD4T5A3_9CYAN|nr:RAMP superfamily protein [Lyngbya confervoides]MCM1983655.1 RAMP superfamily protein [Lyngbya confervoides BDU141951]